MNTDKEIAEELLPPTVTAEEHEAGKKDVTVTFRSGRTETWTVHAVPARQARQALVAVLSGRESSPILAMAVPGHVGDIDKLTLDSLSDLEHVADTLAFGETEQRKLAKAAAALARAMFTAPTESQGSNSETET